MEQIIMKKHLVGIVTMAIAIGAASMAYAQQPERIANWVEQQMPHDWYAGQVKLWKAEIDRNPADANAWMNFYKAKRYFGFGDTTTDEATKLQQSQELLDEMEKAVPDSYEYHHARWWAGGNNLELFPHLQRAFELQQNYAELSDDFICYYELTGDYEKKAFFCRQWYATKAMAPALLEYNYNVLMSLDQNAILVTAGDNDTYPVWLLQNARGIRPDVTVINSSLITVPEYRRRLMKEQNIAGDASLLDWERFAETPPDVCAAQFLKSIAESNTKRPVYFALTCNPAELKLIKENLYTVGLASRYNSTRIDNIALLKRNWKKFRLDYLNFQVYGDDYPFNSSLLPLLNLNYVAPAMLLYEHYLVSGDQTQARHYRDLALNVGRAAEQQEQVEQYISNIGTIDKEEETTEQPAMVEIHENDLGSELSVFPNPAFNTLTVELREASLTAIKLVSLEGKVVRTGATEGRSLNLDISDVPVGTYILQVSSPRGNASRVVEIRR
jgi:hypothetical protein